MTRKIANLLVVLVVLAPAVLTGSVAVADDGPAVFGNVHVVPKDHFANGGVVAVAGMTLFEDGTIRGTGRFIFPDARGQRILSIRGLSWDQIDPATVEVCVAVEVIRNTLGPVISGFCEELPISGTPVGIDIDGDGDVDLFGWVGLTGTP